MNFQDILQVVFLFGILIILTPLTGNYMVSVFSGSNQLMLSGPGWLEKHVYKFLRINPDEETDWKTYTYSLLYLNLTGFVFLFMIQIFQAYLPFNPAELPNISWHSSFNTSISFVTNTNWQGYAGETTLSYFVQMAGLTVQNFLSAATGMAVLLAVIRGFSRKTSGKIGNFWVDITRIIIYILLPLSILMAIFLISQGVIQNFKCYETIRTIQGSEQVIPMGPAASQIAIKQLGSNGGGFFNANSAHPFENPTPISNFIQLLTILLIPAALTFAYGKMVGSIKHGWTIFIVMFILLITGLLFSLYAEYSANPVFGHMPLMEGKETRIGITNSILWSVSTTAVSNGSVNAMHDSLSPVAGMIAMINILTGEVIFGGVGSGLYGMVIFIVLTVFIAGLMVGRTPEYLGKKIESFEIQMAILAVLIPNLAVLLFSALAAISFSGVSGINNPGPHGLSEILYAYGSAAGNNGSAFAGLNTNTVFYNVTLGAGMLLGRYGVIIPVLAMAGKISEKKYTPHSAGTFRTDNWLFVVLLITIILVVGGLTHFPALALGPVMEQLLLIKGVTF